MQPKIKITGQKELLRALSKFGEEAEKRIDQITNIAAVEIAQDAKDRAPRGKETNPDGNATINITQLINVEHTSHLFYTVKVQADEDNPIPAYLEFGTGAFVKVAPEWKDMAWEFYKNGEGRLHPQPYLYPAYTRGKAQYENDLKQLLDQLTKNAL